MAFTVNPNNHDPNKQGGSRPDVRTGKKVLWLIGFKHGRSQNNNVKIDACYVVVHDPDEGKDEQGLVWDTLTLTAAAAWKLEMMAHACKVQAPFDAESGDEFWNALSPNPFMADVKQVPKHNGDGVTANLERASRFGGEITEQMNRIVQEGSTWYSEWLKKQQSGGGRRRAAPSGGDGRPFAPRTDDDIPF